MTKVFEISFNSYSKRFLSALSFTTVPIPLFASNYLFYRGTTIRADSWAPTRLEKWSLIRPLTPWIWVGEWLLGHSLNEFRSKNFSKNTHKNGQKIYSRICLVRRLSNRTILPKIWLTGQFCFFGICLTGQFENLGRLTVLVMFYFQNCPTRQIWL